MITGHGVMDRGDARRLSVGAGRNYHSAKYPVSLGQGCVFYVDMEDAGDIRCIDHVGGNHGTVSGAVRAAVAGGVVRLFDGSDDYVGCGVSSAHNLGTEGSLEAWVRPNIDYPGSAGTTILRGILGKGNAANAAGSAFFLYWTGQTTTPARSLVCYISDGTNLDYICFYTLDFAQKWTHLVITFSMVGANIYGKLYVNGSYKYGRATSLTAGLLASARPLEIGRELEQAARVWSGWIGECGIYGKSLSACEVNARFRRMAPKYGVAS